MFTSDIKTLTHYVVFSLKSDDYSLECENTRVGNTNVGEVDSL